MTSAANPTINIIDGDFTSEDDTPQGDLLSEETASESSEKIYYLTESKLQEIINRAQVGALPPGAYVRSEDGAVVRQIKHPTGRVTREGQMVYHILERKVILISGSGDDAVRKACLQAKATKSDVYHPRVGWLRDGWCKEVDDPENLGLGAVYRKIELVPMPDLDTHESSTSVTAAGVSSEPAGNTPDLTESGQRRRASRADRRHTPIPTEVKVDGV